MQIQLKQAEIVAALKQYISSQGINISNKEVKIHFTAGRKESGISADISVEDATIPGFTDAPADAEKPVLAVVEGTKSIAPILNVVAQAEATAVAKEDTKTEESAPAKTTSLFN